MAVQPSSRRPPDALLTVTTGARPLGSAPSAPDWPPQPAARHTVGDTAAAITTRIVGLLRERSGRGPTKARTNLSRDLVIVTLADCLTTAERQLGANGHGELVTRARRELHDSMRADASATVEELTHRQVVAYLTDQNYDPDLAIIVFLLAPEAPLE